MTAVVLLKPAPETGCDLCPFPVRYMARVRIINPFGTQHQTDIQVCWTCYAKWVEDSDHNLEVGPKETYSRPTPQPLYNQPRTPFMLAGNYWQRREPDEQ
jgi:hypothetical protein